MGLLPSTYYKQGVKVERGEEISATWMVRCTQHDGAQGEAYLQLWDDTNGVELDVEELDAITTDFVQLQVSARVPINCTNVSVRWGFKNMDDGNYFYGDKVRFHRGSAVRIGE